MSYDSPKNITITEERIKFIRNLKGLSQTELATLLGMSRSIINDWENGYASISLKQLIKLSYLFKVPIDYFFGLITKFNREDYTFKETLNLKYLGEKIRTIRIIENMNQKEFAEKIVSTSVSISNYETGKMAITSADLKDICNTFGFSADWCCGNINTCIRRKPKITLQEQEIRTFIEL